MNKKYISIIVLLITGLAIFYFIKNNWADISQVKIVNFWLFIPLVIFSLLFFLLNGHINNIMMKKFGANLSFNEWFGLSLINSMGNYITPVRGGSFANALYLKKKHNFSYTKFLVFNGGITLVSLVIIFLLITIILSFGDYERSLFSNTLFFFFLLLFVIIFTLLNLKIKIKFKKKNWFLVKIEEVINGWQEIRKDQELVYNLAFWLIVNIILISLKDLIAFTIIGYKVDAIKLLFFTIFSSISAVVAITPGGLGIKEGFSMFSAYVINLPLEKVLIVSLIERVVSMLVVIPLGLYYSRKLLNKVNG